MIYIRAEIKTGLDRFQILILALKFVKAHPRQIMIVTVNQEVPLGHELPYIVIINKGETIGC